MHPNLYNTTGNKQAYNFSGTQRKFLDTNQCNHQGNRQRVAVTAKSSSVGVVIVDHGSKVQEANDQLTQFCKIYEQQSGRSIVEAAHMEIASPSIEDAVGKCIERGASKIVVAPFFLARGKHVRKDIPRIVQSVKEKYSASGVSVEVAEPIGSDPLLAQVLETRVIQAMDNQHQNITQT